MNQVLHYHKCDDCLTAFSSPEKKIDYCDCMGTVTYMGQVHGDKYQVIENRPACDGRCTHACGPVCDCQCGGINHGTGKVVATVIHEGKLKVVNLAPEDIERAENFRALRDYCEQVYANYATPSISGVNLVHLLYQARRELDHALSLRVYDKRTKALIDFVGKHK